MTEKTFDLRGLKCPLPVLRTRKALAGMRAGDILVVACTDPLAAIDIPTLLAQTGDILEAKHNEAGATTPLPSAAPAGAGTALPTCRSARRQRSACR